MRVELISRVLGCVLLLALPGVGAAQEMPEPAVSGGGGGGRTLSVLSGRTLQGGTALHAQVGFPGLSLGLLTAASSKIDIGARLSLLYAYEGITRISGVPGVKVQGDFRLGLLERGKLNLGVRASPGIFFSFFRPGTEVGLALPLSLAGGLAVSPKLMVHFGIDVPMFLALGPYGGLAVPVLVGGGVEYALAPKLGLTFSLKAGPSVPLTGYGYYSYWDGYWCNDRGYRYRCGGYYSTAPAVEALLGVSYRL